jgi:hypothetical protein
VVDPEHDWDTFATAWADVPALGQPANAPAGGQAAEPDSTTQSVGVPTLLPDDDFITFRAACRDLLSPTQFAAVDAALARDAAAATRALVPHARASTLTVEELSAWMLQEYDRCATIAEVQVLTRAAQVALFHAGWLLSIDLPRFLATAEAAPRRAQRSQAQWDELRIYRQPHRPLACALAGAGLSIVEMLNLTVADASTSPEATVRVT